MAALVVTLVGCDRVFQLTELPDAGAPDAPPDVPADALTCYGTGLLRLCLDQPLPATITLAGIVDTTIDTGCIEVAQFGDAPPLCVFAAQSFTIIDAVSVRGARPLVLVADLGIRIENMIDVTSRQGKRGPGSQLACGSGGGGADGTAGAGGGAAGSFHFRGGPGATGQSGAALGHASLLPEPILDVRGGCPGFRGGAASGGSRSQSGDGGGAFYAIANGPIDVTASGSIDASGSGGGGGDAGGSGGGGGGAGGFIALDGTVVTIAGPVFARGGGGGGGGGSTADGQPGANPAAPIGQTAGGAGGATGGGPGADGCGGNPVGTDGGFPAVNPAAAGGGGGGGSCGYIRIYGDRSITPGTMNPTPL